MSNSSSHSNSNNENGSASDENQIEKAELKVFSAFAKIPTFFQDIFSPSRRKESPINEHREEIKDYLRIFWNKPDTSIEIIYGSIGAEQSFPSALDRSSFELQVYKQIPLADTRVALWKRIFDITDEHNDKVYLQYKRKWKELETKQAFSKSFAEFISLIEKDVVRIEQNNPLYRISTATNNNSATFDSGNERINALREILVTFLYFQEYEINNEQTKLSIKMRSITDLGYSQGMTDICWVFYNLLHNESDAYWGLVKFMESHGDYFCKDSPSIKYDLICLRKLIELFYDEFYDFLKNCKALNLFFCYRWLVLFFKREFSNIQDVYRIWEVIFTNPYSSKYQIFIVLAIIDSYANELVEIAKTEGYEMEVITNFFASKEFDIDEILKRSEFLFKKYQKLESLITDNDLRQLKQYKK